MRLRKVSVRVLLVTLLAQLHKPRAGGSGGFMSIMIRWPGKVVLGADLSPPSKSLSLPHLPFIDTGSSNPGKYYQPSTCVSVFLNYLGVMFSNFFRLT